MIDFTAPEVYERLVYKKPQSKKEVYLAQKEKLKILANTMSPEDVRKIDMYKLNAV